MCSAVCCVEHDAKPVEVQPFEDFDRDGYTNLEEFLNGTDPRRAVDYTKLANNVDARERSASNPAK